MLRCRLLEQSFSILVKSCCELDAKTETPLMLVCWQTPWCNVTDTRLLKCYHDKQRSNWCVWPRSGGKSSPSRSQTEPEQNITSLCINDEVYLFKLKKMEFEPREEPNWLFLPSLHIFLLRSSSLCDTGNQKIREWNQEGRAIVGLKRKGTWLAGVRNWIFHRRVLCLQVNCCKRGCVQIHIRMHVVT